MNRFNTYKERTKYIKSLFPPMRSNVRLIDFHQTDVDSFTHAEFELVSVRPTRVRTDVFVNDNTEAVAVYGFIVKCKETCYSWYLDSYHRIDYSILICNYTPKPWHNDYNIRAALSCANQCDGYALRMTIEEFGQWCKESII